MFPLLKGDVSEKWKYDHWTPEHTRNVRRMKEILCCYPVLRLSDTKKPFFVLTDDTN